MKTIGLDISGTFADLVFWGSGSDQLALKPSLSLGTQPVPWNKAGALSGTG